MAEPRKHTIHSVGESAERFYAEARAFYAKAEAGADKVVLGLAAKHWTLIGGVLAFALAMAIGDLIHFAAWF